MSSFREASARQRVAGLFDTADGLQQGGQGAHWHEFLPPSMRVVSPHLDTLNAPLAFDDGVVIGRARLGGQRVLFAAQEGGFMGGAVGEVHGAKITGLLQRALVEPVAAVVLLLESGGVRLHEANAGLIAVSEIMRALLTVRGKGIPVIVLIGGANGCFGGAGILARCANVVIMSEEGRMAMSGPEVIETAHGVEEYDAKDRALVWRTSGGKHRYLLGDCQQLVPDTVSSFRHAAITAMNALAGQATGLELAQLEADQLHLSQRLARFGQCRDPSDIWQVMGIPGVEQLPLLDADAFVAQTAAYRHLPPAALPLDSAATITANATFSSASDDASAEATSPWQQLVQALFPAGHQIRQQGQILFGHANPGAPDTTGIAVIGTCEHAQIGVELALQQARLVLNVVRDYPGKPILLLVDTSGQRLRHRDEMLGINSYMAHLGKCIELARRQGHIVLALVYDQALSGGFVATGLMADACYCLPQAQIRVMALAAMARITKVPESVLQELAQHNPVFAPGAENYWKMGGVASMWNTDLAANLVQAMGSAKPQDTRAAWGAVRGGRQMAQQVIQMVVSDVAPA